MRKFILKLTLLVSIIAAGLGVAASGAGATPVPCPGGNNGWFDAINGPYHHAMNCSIDGNHIVVDAHKGAGVATGVMEYWFRPGDTPGFTSFAGGFQVYFNGSGTNWPAIDGTSWATPGSSGGCAYGSQDEIYGIQVKLHRFGEANTYYPTGQGVNYRMQTDNINNDSVHLTRNGGLYQNPAITALFRNYTAMKRAMAAPCAPTEVGGTSTNYYPQS